MNLHHHRKVYWRAPMKDRLLHNLSIVNTPVTWQNYHLNPSFTCLQEGSVIYQVPVVRCC